MHKCIKWVQMYSDFSPVWDFFHINLEAVIPRFDTRRRPNSPRLCGPALVPVTPVVSHKSIPQSLAPRRSRVFIWTRKLCDASVAQQRSWLCYFTFWNYTSMEISWHPETWFGRYPAQHDILNGDYLTIWSLCRNANWLAPSGPLTYPWRAS